MKVKATRRRMISCFAQIITGYVLGYRIPELAKREKIKARKLSYGSQMYLLMLGQFLHVFSLNELVDISKTYACRRGRGREWVCVGVFRYCPTLGDPNRPYPVGAQSRSRS